MKEEQCWICGDKACSREHLLKASDIRSVFGDISEAKRLAIRDPDGNVIKKIKSAKSKNLTSQARICEYCNNTRTQPHDYAWERLSGLLRSYPLTKRGPLVVRLSKVFSGGIYPGVLAAHLYLVKLFGHLIIDYDVPIDTSSLSNAIMASTPCPHVFTYFRKGLRLDIKMVDMSPIVTWKSESGTSAVWYYNVGDLYVESIYVPRGGLEFLKDSFHPQCQHKRIIFKDLPLTDEEHIDQDIVEDVKNTDLANRTKTVTSG